MHKDLLIKVINSEQNTEYTTKGVVTDKEIKYVENDELNTIAKFNLINNTLTRKNNNLRLRYPFVLDKETLGEVEIKELNKKIKVKIKTKKIEKKERSIRIEFSVEKEDFIYYIEEK